MSSTKLSLSSQLSSDELYFLQQWYFWLKELERDPRSSNPSDTSIVPSNRIEDCVKWATAAQVEGLLTAPPWLFILFGLSLSPHLKDQERLQRVLHHTHLNPSSRLAIQLIYEQWLIPTMNRSDWHLARRKILISSPQIQATLTGFCIAQLINDSHLFKHFEFDRLDLATLNLLNDPRIVSHLHHQEYVLETLPEDLDRMADMLSTQPSQPFSSSIKQYTGIIEHFERLYSPSRRVLYHRLSDRYQQLGYAQKHASSISQISHHSQQPQKSEYVSSMGAINALGRSGTMEHVSQSEWAYLGQELSKNLDYFMLKWSENDLLYFQRETWTPSKTHWSITWDFRDLHRLLDTMTDGLSSLSWLHLSSLWITRALHHVLGSDCLHSQWQWEALEILKSEHILEAEIDVFKTFNPLLRSDNLTKVNDKHLTISFSARALSHSSPNQINIFLDQHALYRIQLPSRLHRKVQHTPFLSEMDLNSMTLITSQSSPSSSILLNDREDDLPYLNLSRGILRILKDLLT